MTTGAAELKTKYFCDLHTHSAASDGLLPPAQVVQLAHSEGLCALALTDHDTLSGLNEAAAAAKELGLRFIFGVELSCLLRRREQAPIKVHLLGYWPFFPTGELPAALDKLLAMRLARAEEIGRRLAALNVPIDMATLLNTRHGGHIGRPHLAAALVKAGHVATPEEAFTRYLQDGGPAYVPYTEPLDVIRALRLIVASGGRAVIAHPGEYGFKAIDSELFDLKAAGLFGLECGHPSNDALVERHYRAICQKMDLFPSAGSDYHGSARHGAPPGSYGLYKEDFLELTKGW